MNHLHSFLMTFPEEKRMSIVLAAYSNAKPNRDDVILEEGMLTARRRITLEKHEQEVLSYIYKSK